MGTTASITVLRQQAAPSENPKFDCFAQVVYRDGYPEGAGLVLHQCCLTPSLVDSLIEVFKQGAPRALSYDLTDPEDIRVTATAFFTGPSDQMVEEVVDDLAVPAALCKAFSEDHPDHFYALLQTESGVSAWAFDEREDRYIPLALHARRWKERVEYDEPLNVRTLPIPEGHEPLISRWSTKI